MLQAVTTKKGIIIENNFYLIFLNTWRGGTVSYFRIKNAGNAFVYREGCEIWDETWGPFHPYHYQQEHENIPEIEIESDETTIKVNVKSHLGISKHPHRQQRGLCINTWLFRDDSPLISCDFQISHDSLINDTIGLTMFKKYVCLRARAYSRWAYKNDEVISRLIKSKRFKVILNPPPKWITFLQKYQGFALIIPENQLENCYGMLYRQKAMIEILYYCRRQTENFTSSIQYLAYPTTLCTLRSKWKPIEEYL